MSLLDDVSIVVTPNGYKAGELYAVIPVPTEGSEEIPTPDFSSSTGWSFTNSGGSNGWIIDAGRAICDSSAATPYRNLNSTFSLVNGKSYRLIIDILQSADNMKIVIGVTTLAETLPTGTNLNYEYFIPASLHSGGGFTIYGGSSDLQEIDNVSVKEYTSADMDVTRNTAATRVDENGLVNYAEVLGGDLVNTIENDTTYAFPTFTDNGGGSYTMVTTTTAYSGFEQPASDVFAVAVGEIYKLTFDFVLNSGALDLELFIGSGAVGSSYGNRHICQVGSNTAFITIITSNSSARLASQINSVANMTINNIVLKKVDRENVPRIDYTGGGCPHILAEPMRTNEVTYSEDFSQWTPVNDTAISNTTLSNPSGVSDVGFAEATAGTSVKYFIEAAVSTVKSTVSIYLKYNSHQWVQITGLGGKTSYANFDIQNGVLGSSSGGTSKITLFGDGWYRCELSESADQNGSNIAVALVASGTSTRLSNTSLIGSIYIWGAQLEQGSYATSYIPNFGTAAGVTRNQDIFTRDGIGSLINSTEGVLFVEMAALATSIDSGYLSLNNGGNYQIRVGYLSGNIYIQIRINGAVPYSYSFAGTITDFNKIAVKWTTTEQKVYVNGSPVDTGTASTIFPSGTLNNMEFSVNGVTPLFAKVKQLQVYDTALTDDQIRQITQ